jgi:putative ABC transport system ATP-binding protein
MPSGVAPGRPERRDAVHPAPGRIDYTADVATQPPISQSLDPRFNAAPNGLARGDGTILEARNLTKRYRLGSRDVEALRGVSLRVKRGEFVALMGPSGSGKSTLLQLLGGLDRPTSGEVVLDGEVISHLSDGQATCLRREKTGFVFQFFNLIPLLDVYENVALPFTIAGVDPRRGEAATRIHAVLELVDLLGRERNRPDQLSAGEQQRVALARALVGRPAILLADEPTGNLDYATGGEILDELWRSCDELGQTIVLVTHDARAAAHADRVLVVGDGRIRDEIELGRRSNRDAGPLIARLAQLGL